MHPAQYSADADKIARQCATALGDAIGPAFQIAQPLEEFANLQAQGRVVVKGLDRVLACVDSIKVEQGLAQPAAQQPAAHGRQRLVEHVEQAAFGIAAAHGLGQFQIAPGRFIQRHEFACRIGVDLVQLAQRAGLHLFEIGQHGRGRAHRLDAPLEAIAVQAADAEVALERLACRVGLDLPRFHR